MGERLTDDGGGGGGMLIPGKWRNLEESPEFGVGAKEGDTGKTMEVIKTDLKCKEALNVRTGNLKLMMEVRGRRKRLTGKWGVAPLEERWRPVTGIGNPGWLEFWGRKDCKGRENFQLSCVSCASQIY